MALVKVRGISNKMQEIGETNGSLPTLTITKKPNIETIAFGADEEPEHKAFDGAPIAADETKDPNAFWVADPCDDVLPTHKGFITDLIYYTRGREVPTLFVVWAAVMIISSLVKREAWIKWADGKLFSNIYAMICAPAGAVRKNSAIDLVVKMLDYIDQDIPDENVAKMKMINPFMSRATPEAIISAMANKEKRAKDFVLRDEHDQVIKHNGKPVKYIAGAELAITQHEMSTLIGKQSYMEGLIQNLLNWYDCHDRWTNTTQARGNEDLVNMFVTFFAALTPTTLKELPPSITGDGFLSRTIIVYQAFSEREFDEPIIPEGAPDVKELRRRLGWIATNTMGEFTWSPEAKAYRKIMYHRIRLNLATAGAYQGVMSRLYATFCKLAMIMRWQRYERDNNEIQLDDVFDAEYLLMRTFEEGTPMYQHALNIDSSDMHVRVGDFIARAIVISRPHLIKQSHIKADVVTEAMEQLINENKVRIYDPSTLQILKYNRARNGDLYVWIGDKTKVVRSTREKFKLTPEVVEYYNKYTMGQILRERDNISPEEQAMIDIVKKSDAELMSDYEEHSITNFVKERVKKWKLKQVRQGASFDEVIPEENPLDAFIDLQNDNNVPMPELEEDFYEERD